MLKLEQNPYGHIRGFNYVPSYALVLNDIIDRYDGEVIRRELVLAQELGVNSIRMWFSDVSYLRDAAHFLRSFEDLLTVVNDYGMTLIPTLFNRWADPLYPIGQLDLVEALGNLCETKKKYIQDLVHAFRHDPRILMWDMCNEPFQYDKIYSRDDAVHEMLFTREVRFFKQCFAAFREINPLQPLTIGLMVPSWPELEEINRLVDVISFHPYSGWWDDSFKKGLQKEIAYANRIGKPLLCTETCQGSLTDAVRETCIQNSLGTLNGYEIGWYAWVLCAGEMVSMRRDRTDTNAKPGDRGYMCFFKRDGKLRPGHDVIKKFI